MPLPDQILRPKEYHEKLKGSFCEHYRECDYNEMDIKCQKCYFEYLKKCGIHLPEPSDE